MTAALKMMMAAAGAGAAVQTLSEAILALNPQGYWKLDDTSGTTATDSSGNGHHGTYTGSYTLASYAAPDGGNYVELGVSGSSSHIAIPDDNAFSLATASGLTFFAITKPDSVAGTTRQFVLSKGAASNYEYGFEQNASVAGRLGLFCWTSGGVTIRSVVTDAGVLTTDWQAVAANAASPSVSSSIDLRRNSNTALTAVTKNGTVNSPTNGTAALWLGWRADSPASQFHNGGLAHVAVFAGEVDLSAVFAAYSTEWP